MDGRRSGGLNTETQNWPTMRANDAKDSTYMLVNGRKVDVLPGAAKAWPTSKTSDLKGADSARTENRSGVRHEGDGLETVAERNWPTPSARDWKGSPDAVRSEGEGSAAERLDQLDRVAEHFPYSRRCETTMPDGLACLLGDRTLHPLSRLLLAVYRNVFLRRWLRLNPAFSEWLIGWPAGWTAFDSSETEYRLWLHRWRSHLFGSSWSGEWSDESR